jgi:hypothetical protein
MLFELGIDNRILLEKTTALPAGIRDLGVDRDLAAGGGTVSGYLDPSRT